jgi:lysophospholipase L1-like esterase
MNNVLFVGDSWAAGQVEGGEGPSFLDILTVPAELRCGVCGSRINDWASNCDGRLTNASAQTADVLVFCLGGNDAMDSGGNSIEVIKQKADDLYRVYSLVRKERNIVMLYANPRMMNECYYLNLAIQIALSGHGVPDPEFLWLTPILSDGDLSDSKTPHPTPSGHIKIANALKDLIG